VPESFGKSTLPLRRRDNDQSGLFPLTFDVFSFDFISTFVICQAKMVKKNIQFEIADNSAYFFKN
jgi:hypothetical protein